MSARAALLVLALASATRARADGDAAPVVTATSALTAAEEAAIEAASRRVADALAPSVVEVESLGGLEEEFRAPEDENGAEGGVLAKKGFKQAFGPMTGLVVGREGLVLTTTFAVRRDPRHIIVTLQDGRSFVARVRGRDEARALVLLAIDAKDLPVPRMAAPEEVRTGRIALALGRGLGGPALAVSRGIVSAVGRLGGLALQSSAAISPVNYGGPLCAIDGSVLGILVPLAINGGMASVDIYDSGIGFAVPASDLAALVPRLSQGETLRPGMLGVQPVADATGDGARIESVAPGTPAAAAGLQPGDTIVAVGADSVTAAWQLRRALARLHEGDRVVLEVRRGTRTFKVEAVLAPVPREAEPSEEDPHAPHGPHGPRGPGAPGQPGPPAPPPPGRNP